MGRLKLPRRFYIDSNVFIDLLDGITERADRLRALFALLRARPMQAVTSELTLAEIRGKESQKIAWQEQSSFYLELVVWGRLIDLRPVSREIFWATGELRREARAQGRSLALADAIHITTAVGARCDYVVSADRRLPLRPSLQRIAPQSIDLQQIEQLLDA